MAPATRPGDAAGAATFTLTLRDGRTVALADREAVRPWRADAALAAVGFGGGAFALVVGVVAYLLALEATLGLLLLLANGGLALMLASMPLAVAQDPAGMAVVGVALPVLPALYLLFALRFPRDLLLTRARCRGVAAWLLLGLAAGAGVALAERGRWFYTPPGAALGTAASGLFAASCCCGVALLARQ